MLIMIQSRRPSTFPGRPPQLIRDIKPTKLIKRYRIDDAEGFQLAAFDPTDTGGSISTRTTPTRCWRRTSSVSPGCAAGKDGVIKHVMSGVNPQGCEVYPFKPLTAEELDHDFLWRSAIRLPKRGHIGIFNRSHYEEVLVVRVHPDMLARQKLPEKLVTKNIWKERFKDIRGFESHLARNGVAVIKVFLHISKEEQRRRLLARLDEPAKRWKFALGDIAERKLWDKYMAAYEDTIRATSQPEAPWYVVPADHKWFARLLVAGAMIEALEGLDPQFPKIECAALKELQKVRAALVAEESGKRPSK